VQTKLYFSLLPVKIKTKLHNIKPSDTKERLAMKLVLFR